MRRWRRPAATIVRGRSSSSSLVESGQGPFDTSSSDTLHLRAQGVDLMSDPLRDERVGNQTLAVGHVVEAFEHVGIWPESLDAERHHEHATSLLRGLLDEGANTLFGWLALLRPVFT